MFKIKLRYQKISDAKRFFEILNNSNFIYFPVRPKTLKEEINFLKTSGKKRRLNISHNFSIICQNKLVGGCGLKINQHRKQIAEIGYFVDEKFWSRGITTAAVKELEKIAFKKLGIKRIEILMRPANKASEKVAIKNGYQREGLLNDLGDGKGKMLFYAKVQLTN